MIHASAAQKVISLGNPNLLLLSLSLPCYGASIGIVVDSVSAGLLVPAELSATAVGEQEQGEALSSKLCFDRHQLIDLINISRMIWPRAFPICSTPVTSSAFIKPLLFSA
jgi:hypothetical protein